MIKLLNLLTEISRVNWVVPDLTTLKREFNVEHELKGKNIFNSEQDFINRVKTAKIITVTPLIDNQINNRSQTSSKEELLDLIKSYRSYPEFRNEKTLDNLYYIMKNGGQMDMPIIIRKNNNMTIFSGNTRMDVAFQLNINPRCIIIDI